MTGAIVLEAAIIGAGIALITGQWIATIRLKGSIQKMQVRRSIGLLLHSWQVFLALLCVVLAAIALGVSASLHASAIEAVIAATAIACVCVCLSYIVVPPRIVVLGRSTSTTKRLVRSLALAVFPLRVVHLLYAHPFADPLAFLTGLRNWDSRRWRKSIRDLMALTEMVAVDASQTSSAVLAEATASLGEDIVEKVVFVVPASDSSALLESLLANTQAELPHIMVAKPGQLVRWMRALAWKSLKRRNDFSVGPMATALIASRRRWTQGGNASEKSKLCAEVLRLVEKGATADELCDHVEACHICQLRPRRFASAIDNAAMLRDSTIRRTLIVGVHGPLPPIPDIIKRLEESNQELVIFQSDSPGAQNPNWLWKAMRAMASDPELYLIVEDDRISPTPMAPCIAVRGTLLLRYPLTDFPPITLHAFASRLMQLADVEGRAYRKQALVEVPPDLL